MSATPLVEQTAVVDPPDDQNLRSSPGLVGRELRLAGLRRGRQPHLELSPAVHLRETELVADALLLQHHLPEEAAVALLAADLLTGAELRLCRVPALRGRVPHLVGAAAPLGRVQLALQRHGGRSDRRPAAVHVRGPGGGRLLLLDPRVRRNGCLLLRGRLLGLRCFRGLLLQSPMGANRGCRRFRIRLRSGSLPLRRRR
mmetsp:Transcript_68059/g.212889  ORF Transcript_68059/g.212889 Transcript_68059/m.212889 type:complete len:200 (-) Transcript_68059:284-883(-)